MPPKRKAPSIKDTPPPSESKPKSEPEDVSEEEPESLKPKKPKAAEKPKAPAKTKAATPVAVQPKKAKPAPKKKKETTRKGAKVEVAAEKSGPASTLHKESKPEAVAKQVIIEHCKQCQSFKRTAMKLEGLLKTAVPKLEVTLNPEKPRKGIFEIRDDGGNIFLSLQGLVRPFKKMKDLNLEETAEEVASLLS